MTVATTQATRGYIAITVATAESTRGFAFAASLTVYIVIAIAHQKVQE
jgi:hypothetical protein